MGAEEVNIKGERCLLSGKCSPYVQWPSLGDEEKVAACGLSCVNRHIYQHSDISTYIVTFRRTWWHFHQHSVISINTVTFLKQSGTESFCTLYSVQVHPW